MLSTRDVYSQYDSPARKGVFLQDEALGTEISTMQLKNILFPFLATAALAQTVYLIRHGEKPSDGSNGLSAQGMQRAQCLRNVFGLSSQYNIGYIIAEQPKKSETPFQSCYVLK
jgi:hypothetical protein